ncbi:MAG: hypothetical protein RQ748_02470 [Elusimicrobiales bacterium]|nr:hypothetical protein [Elusimicrobiales bacterium]
MSSLSEKFQEFKFSEDPSAVPWEDAVVWVTDDGAGGRLYEWLPADEIRHVSWTNGIISILPARDSFLAKRFQCVVLPPAMVFVGINVKTSN